MVFTPVMYGDAVLDEKLGFTILSGDQLVAYLAIKYNASKIVVGTDTDGIFDADPKTNPDAKPYKTPNLGRTQSRFSLNLAKQQEQTLQAAWQEKSLNLSQPSKQAVHVTVTGATKGLSIYRALTDQSVLGTEIEKT